MGVKRSAITRPIELSLLLHSSVIYSISFLIIFYKPCISSKKKYIHSLTLVFGDLFYAGGGIRGLGKPSMQHQPYTP